MKRIPIYDALNAATDDDVFNHLASTFKPSNMRYDYFVNWEKASANTEKFRSTLTKMDSLIGVQDFEQEFRKLLESTPEIVQIIPVLLAVRDQSSFKIIDGVVDRQINYVDFDFSKSFKLDNETFASLLKFIIDTGLIRLFDGQSIASFKDYLFGVEAGLDSNARKNRGGHSMESLTEEFVKEFCNITGSTYMKEATAQHILSKFDVKIPTDKSSRRFDFAIQTTKKLLLIETNFYGGGGSKLKATAGEYISLQQKLWEARNEVDFVWVTDGFGWLSTLRPLRETFNHNDYIFNLDLLEKGALHSVSIT